MDEIVLPPGTLVDYVLPDGSHHYYSTHCRHGDHRACSAVELAPGVSRRPASCKRCGAPCSCPAPGCHDGGPGVTDNEMVGVA